MKSSKTWKIIIFAQTTTIVKMSTPCPSIYHYSNHSLILSLSLIALLTHPHLSRTQSGKFNQPYNLYITWLKKNWLLLWLPNSLEKLSSYQRLLATIFWNINSSLPTTWTIPLPKSYLTTSTMIPNHTRKHWTVKPTNLTFISTTATLDARLQTTFANHHILRPSSLTTKTKRFFNLKGG